MQMLVGARAKGSGAGSVTDFGTTEQRVCPGLATWPPDIRVSEAGNRAFQKCGFSDYMLSVLLT